MAIRKVNELLAEQVASEEAERQRWGQLIEAERDLRELARILRGLMPGVPLPCCCCNATCERCEMERIVEQWSKPKAACSCQDVAGDGLLRCMVCGELLPRTALMLEPCGTLVCRDGDACELRILAQAVVVDEG